MIIKCLRDVNMSQHIMTKMYGKRTLLERRGGEKYIEGYISMKDH